MSSPTNDPIPVLIMTALAAALAQISSANGYYCDVVSAGIEPIAFTAADNYPQIVVEEESAIVSESNGAMAWIDGIYAATGFIPVTTLGAIATAHRLRVDILRTLGAISKNHGAIFQIDGRPLVRSFQVLGSLEVGVAQDAQDFVLAKVHVSISHPQSFNS